MDPPNQSTFLNPFRIFPFMVLPAFTGGDGIVETSWLGSNFLYKIWTAKDPDGRTDS